jgi:thioredoxin reductase (NADPH)
MITGETLRPWPLFHGLPDCELDAIAGRAADVHLAPGEWLIQEGEVAAFFVLLEGRLAVMKSLAGVPTQISAYRPGAFFGELPLLLGSPAVAGLQAVQPCRVARFDERDFRELIVQCDAMSGAVMRAMARRVGHLQQLGSEAKTAAVTIVGSRLDPACHDLRDFLARNRVPYDWLDPGHPDADPRSLPDVPLPQVRLPDGTVLVAPDLRTLASAVGLPTSPARCSYDVIIVGGGPAGLAAAVYGASEGLSTLLVERAAVGGQAGTSSRIENYLGFPAGLSGDDLSARARQQAERFGAELVVGRTVGALTVSPASLAQPHRLHLEDGTELSARAVVLATGVAWRRLGAPGVEQLVGRGVYYGAARTEALSMRGKRIQLIGGGNSAGQAAMLFANYADHVTVLVRGPNLAASMSTYLTRQLASQANITVALNTEVIACTGEQSLQAVTVRDRVTGTAREVDSDGLFVFIGAVAQTSWLGSTVQRDRLGYLRTGPAVHADRWPLARDPYLLETSVPGIFAAGDTRSGSVKRVASGVGEGSMAITFIHQHLAQPEANTQPRRTRLIHSPRTPEETTLAEPPPAPPATPRGPDHWVDTPGG